MGVLANLVQQAQPALYGAGCNAQVTAGATWRWQFTVTNPDGSAVTLTSATGTCKILSSPTGSVLATLTFTGAVGSFTLELDEATTATLATTDTVRAHWYMTLGDGTDVVQVWSSTNSRIVIDPKGT
jgi:hypothetical protein